MLRWDFRLAQPSRGHPKIAIRIRLPHRGVTPHPARSTLLKVSAGWHMHLDVLVARATGKEPAPFWEGWSRLHKEYGQRLPA